ncbi:MAG TPA: Stp1/IreP family PP2C-type Ser/Thr phosphatase [Acidobacteriaceae bacterium]|jgi:protein phosphatase|nr:Stp1/IreP family PP2C-type Ser/Thr phosphatase [Acidobacteriaceae bacterium]
MKTSNPWLPEAAAHTSTGRVRSSNEDAYGYRADHGIFVVCDGMGGAAGGEVASRMTVEALLERMCTEDAATAGPATLHEAIAEANRTVLERADRDPGLYGMGTTLVALLLRPGSALIAHAGDSRCYLYRSGDLERQTHDHSLVDEQMRLGTMTREEAARSPFRSVITRAVGTQKSVTEEVLEIETKPGDVFLLCTDGLTREVNEEQMAEILGSEATLNGAAECLVEAANEAGGHDNVTCLLTRVP